MKRIALVCPVILMIVLASCPLDDGSRMTIRQDGNLVSTDSGQFDFGYVYVDRTSQVVTFTIENSGSGLLTLTGVPAVEITGTDGGNFDTPSQPATEIAGGGSPDSVFGRRSAPTRVSRAVWFG